jgi:hypothetical protein
MFEDDRKTTKLKPETSIRNNRFMKIHGNVTFSLPLMEPNDAHTP